MRSSAVSFAKGNVPMIKFVGGRHAIGAMNVVPHPCTVDGLMPGSDRWLSVRDFLAKQAPFEVIPYVSKGGSGGGGQYVFKQRPLKENEVSSLLELPKKYRMRPMEELEIDIINHGGIN
ncbi:alpha-ketoglutarate dehydrogenase subunit KGD4 Ecym_6010 [Eremothecium cymbalariae DBVPG|uniref:Uncharacterized protein n=1 Tax=Eremothecium cymbalariae (strain CBS 270.75 / DBVPG 7215 / KCTC 17166 / NRRL Y-17582) TaxID=931890 RepID=G8JUT9_ERECY|nr:hypothetical protein Ecym_6010 [Eremothecium cymbalariae DBVPG\